MVPLGALILQGQRTEDIDRDHCISVNYNYLFSHPCPESCHHTLRCWLIFSMNGILSFQRQLCLPEWSSGLLPFKPKNWRRPMKHDAARRTASHPVQASPSPPKDARLLPTLGSSRRPPQGPGPSMPAPNRGG